MPNSVIEVECTATVELRLVGPPVLGTSACIRSVESVITTARRKRPDRTGAAIRTSLATSQTVGTVASSTSPSTTTIGGSSGASSRPSRGLVMTIRIAAGFGAGSTRAGPAPAGGASARPEPPAPSSADRRVLSSPPEVSGMGDCAPDLRGIEPARRSADISRFGRLGAGTANSARRLAWLGSSPGAAAFGAASGDTVVPAGRPTAPSWSATLGAAASTAGVVSVRWGPGEIGAGDGLASGRGAAPHGGSPPAGLGVDARGSVTPVPGSTSDVPPVGPCRSAGPGLTWELSVPGATS
jgi:hypothetical protein